MFITYLVIAILLTVILLVSAGGKFAGVARIAATMAKVEVAPRQVPLLAACEIAGGVGLMAGLFFAPLGIAAATGVILYFTGAVLAHVRVHDRDLLAPAVILLIAVAALFTRILSS
jgi:hypothetical protein